MDNLLMDNLTVLTLNCPSDINADILRLDQLHPVISGNKWFKLKGHLQQASAAHPVITFGGAWSNHLIATAYATRQKGIPSIGIVRGENPPVLSATLIAAAAYGMRAWISHVSANLNPSPSLPSRGSSGPERSGWYTHSSRPNSPISSARAEAASGLRTLLRPDGDGPATVWVGLDVQDVGGLIHREISHASNAPSLDMAALTGRDAAPGEPFDR